MTDGGILGKVHGKGCLAHGRTPSDHDQVGGWNPAVMVSRSVNPLDRPVMASPDWHRWSIRSTAAVRQALSVITIIDVVMFKLFDGYECE